MTSLELGAVLALVALITTGAGAALAPRSNRGAAAVRILGALALLVLVAAAVTLAVT